MRKFCDVISGMIDQNIPFFLYRLPNENKIHCGVQSNSELQKAPIDSFIGKEGFIIAPFENKYAYLLTPDYLFDLPSDLHVLAELTLQLSFFTSQEETSPVIESSYEEYISQCNRYIDQIRTGRAEKAILARCVKTDRLTRKKAGYIFTQLEACYKDACVFLVNLPGVTTWIGASPETLLKVHNDSFITMSLAGTRKWEAGITEHVETWAAKEKKEQAIVTEYIYNKLISSQVKKVTCEPLCVKKAGGVGHLQTMIHGVLSHCQIADLIMALHPTPAVCGSPTSEALTMIHEIESLSRDFYAGYLGYQEANGDLALFVNLRSARLLNEYGLLYVGGGITADSVPENEWEETCLKAQTILNVLN
ncbi:MAG: isochorismate synthase [Bacteroidales bacterium]